MGLDVSLGFIAVAQRRAENLAISGMGKWQSQCTLEAHPTQLGVLGGLEARFPTAPSCDEEDVISGLAVVLWARFRQDGNLLEGARRNAYLFLHFPHHGVARGFVPLAMSTDDIPDTGIEGPLGRASGQQHFASPN